MNATDKSRIPLLATAGRWGCIVTAVALVAVTWTYVFTQPIVTLTAPLGFVSLDHASAWQFILVRIIACLVSAAGAAALLALAACFRAMTGESPFAATAPALSRFASAVLAAVVLSAVTAPISCLILSVGAAPGQGRLVISLGGNQMLVLLAAGAFFALARLLDEAARIERENAEFV